MALFIIENLEIVRQIVLRNTKRAQASRLRYQNMTPEERRIYNSKRYTRVSDRVPKQTNVDVVEFNNESGETGTESTNS